MQYLQFLEKQILELRLSSVLETMIFKSYIITSMGIIEALFVNLLKATNNWKTSEWELLLDAHSNQKKYEGKTIKVDTIIYKKVESYEINMDLDSMIKKIEDKKLLDVDHNIFSALKKLKRLRNRVHLQEGIKSNDHDFNNFNKEEFMRMREILYLILISSEFCNEVQQYSFLNIDIVQN